MAFKDKIKFPSSRARPGRLLFWVLCTLCVIAVALIVWLGGNDTHVAMEDGRRLLIMLDSGAIEGKQISLDSLRPHDASNPAETQKPASASEPSQAAAPEEAASASATAQNPADSEAASAATEPATAEEPPEASTSESFPDLSDMGPVKPATVPLAEIKDVLMQKTPAGAVPIIGPKDLKPWQYYAKPYVHKGQKPTIAIIITGLGQNKLVSEAAIKLPENFSLSFSAYAKDIATWANAARSAGHEILLDLPLQPNNFPASDPGPYGLLVGKGTQENANRMQWLMSRAQGYTGFVTPQNEAFSENEAAYKDLLDLLAEHGLMMAIVRESPKDDTKKVLENSKAAHVTADFVIDEELSATAIRARLTSLEKAASKRGFAIGIAQAFPLTIQQLNVWSADLEKEGFTLVPVTFITKLKFH